MNRKSKMSFEEKVKIVTLHEQNMNNCEIARKIKCSETTVRNVLRKYKETGELNRKKGSGKLKKTTRRDERILKRLCLQNRFASAVELKEQLEKSSETKVSVRTIQRRLNEMGFFSRKPAKKPLLTAEMKRKRLQWAKNHRNWTVDDWKRVIFSDESKFNLIGPDGFQRVRRRKHERFSEECTTPTVKHSQYVMVWGAITSLGVGRLLMLRGMVNAQEYLNIIDEGVIPTFEELSSEVLEPIFQDDSAPCHRAKCVKDYKERLGLISLDWPGNSPDLNPIENIWSLMSRKLTNSRPENLQKLEETLERIWSDEINEDIIENLYLSMPNRIKNVIKAKGGAIQY